MAYRIYIFNDTNAGGFAERWERTGIEYMAYLSLSQGVGGAILISERAYLGQMGRSGEFGHMCIHPRGMQCSCGRRGCLEAYCSTARLSDDLGITLKAFFSKMAEGNRSYHRLWVNYLDDLYIGISNIYAALDCSIVLGGKLSQFLIEHFQVLDQQMREMDSYYQEQYVNSRLASCGISVACEVDIYGALSKYIGACINTDAVTILDINNTIPQSLYNEQMAGKFDYRLTDTFMGFHCGNTPSCKMCPERAVKYQLIQHRLIEPEGSAPDFTRYTLEGDLTAGDVTLYRLQYDSDGILRAYVTQMEILPVPTGSFGGIGIFAIPEMGRFYRHVLLEKRFPHHGAVAFEHYGKLLFKLFRFLGIRDISYN